MKIVVIFPTATEARDFAHPSADIVIGGVGLTASAYSTLKAIEQHRPDVLILAGIAGMYPAAPLKIGDTVLVASECEADLGFFTPDGFRHLSRLAIDMDFEPRHTLDCPYLPALSPFPLASSYSVNAALAPFIDTSGIDIENMEGAAFFHVCRQEGQRFYELRSISNVVRPGHDDWDLDLSVRRLAEGLKRFIGQLLDGQI
ncbi:purine phosphorylase [Paludibacterium yongneupense]|uniref:phosphorylase family protein n=1 Tax=Paludibacterium yongneupense TaxID=400061 RepID=UPI0004290F70|nr:purine phosphorylase [Paludibacterium yongneupense]